MYDGNVGAARFPDFSPMSKLESWCKIYFGLSLCCKKFRPLPLLQKGLYRRGQLFGIDGFLRVPSAAHLIASMTIRFDSGGTLLAIGLAGFRV
jgi:hypothetical protein